MGTVERKQRIKLFKIFAAYGSNVQTTLLEAKSTAEALNIASILYPNATTRTVHPTQYVSQGGYYGTDR